MSTFKGILKRLCKVRVELSCYMPWRHLGEDRYNSYLFLASALDGGEVISEITEIS
jgi:hypothetical protein